MIEPVIQPLGFDWKIGVALIASFAAREVLVSTLSIIYNVGKDATEESPSLINAVRDAKKDDGTKAWTPLTALTLMVFFVLRDAVYVNRCGCPARNKFVVLGVFYGRLYDGFGLFRGVFDLSGRKAFRVWLNYEYSNGNCRSYNFYRAFLRRRKCLAQS